MEQNAGDELTEVMPPPAPLSIDISNGLIAFLVCWDSFQVLVSVVSHLVESFQV